MTKLSRYEKETVINWNEAEKLASIYTFNAGLKRRLADFSRRHPMLCRLELNTPEGGVTYVLDKARLSIRLVPPYSEERLAAARAYAKEHGFQTVKKTSEMGAISEKHRVCIQRLDRQSLRVHSASTFRRRGQMRGCGAGESGGNCIGDGRRLCRYGCAEGSQPFAPRCRGGSALLGSRGNAPWPGTGRQRLSGIQRAAPVAQ